MSNSDFEQLWGTSLQGASLTLAEITYRMPDHLDLLQTFIWQDYDIHPHFPKLTDFLVFWVEQIEGPLYGVRIAHNQLLKPAELEAVHVEYQLGQGTLLLN